MPFVQRAFARTGELVQHHPVLSLVVAVLVVFVALGGVVQLTSVAGDTAFVRETPALATYGETFDRPAVAVVVRGDVTEPETMRAIDRFDARMEAAPDVLTVSSPADQVRRQYGSIPDSSADIEAVVGTPEFVVVSVVQTTGLTETESAAVYDRTVAAEAWAQFPVGTTVVVTGDPAYNAQLTVVIGESTQQLLGLAVGLMIVALFFLFRGVRLRLLPIVAVFVGIVYTMGTLGYVGIPNSTLTSAVFPILIGLGIDYSVQFHQRYEEELRTAPPVIALPRAMGAIGPAVLVAMTAAILGFAATGYTGRAVPSLVWFAQTSIIGILATFSTAIVVLLATLTLYVQWQGDAGGDVDATDDRSTVGRDNSTADATDDRPMTGVERLFARGSRLLALHPASVFLVAGLLMVGGFHAGNSLEMMTDTDEFVPPDLPALLDLNTLRSLTGGGSDVQFSVLVSGPITDPETLRWMDDFETVAVASPTITGVETPADAVRAYNDGVLPETAAETAAVFDRMPSGVRTQYLTDGYGQVRVTAVPGMDTTQQLTFERAVTDAIVFSEPPPGVDATLVDSTLVTGRSITETIENRNVTTAIGLFLVFLLLLGYYRDPVKAVAPLVPITFVIGWQGLFMFVFAIPVSPLGAALGALTVGIGAEYTVIPMERYFEEKAHGASKLEAIEIAAGRVGKTITVSALTTVFGFSALLLSPFPILSDFGLLTVGVIAMTLVAALVTLPPTLLVLDELREWVTEARVRRGVRREVYSQT